MLPVRRYWPHDICACGPVVLIHEATVAPHRSYSVRSALVLARLRFLSGPVLSLHLQHARLLSDASLVASDPPARFISGVMAYDYPRTAFGSDPLAFAQSYYVRYPKVANGHWPPFY